MGPRRATWRAPSRPGVPSRLGRLRWPARAGEGQQQVMTAGPGPGQGASAAGAERLAGGPDGQGAGAVGRAGDGAGRQQHGVAEPPPAAGARAEGLRRGRQGGRRARGSPQPRQPQATCLRAARDQVSQPGPGRGPAVLECTAESGPARPQEGPRPGLWRSWCRGRPEGPQGPPGLCCPLVASAPQGCEALGTRKAYFGVTSRVPSGLLSPHLTPPLLTLAPTPHPLASDSTAEIRKARRADIPAGLGGGGGRGCQRHCPEGIC